MHAASWSCRASATRSSAKACLIVASATWAETSRISERPGKMTPRALSSSDGYEATASAAAISIPSVMIRAPEMTVPRPRPGKTYMLFAWLATHSFPSMVDVGKGEPEPKIARPPVAVKASSAVHSALEVGLDMGNSSGTSLLSAIHCSTSELKIRPAPETPSSTVASAAGSTSSRGVPPSRSSRM